MALMLRMMALLSVWVAGCCFLEEAAEAAGRWYLVPGVSYLAWQEPLTLNRADGTSLPAVSMTSAGCAGVSGLYRMPRDFDIDLSGCFIFGQASASLQSSASATSIAYQAQSITTVGGEVSLGMSYRPSSGSVSLGISVPVIFRSVAFPAPETGASVVTPSALSVGAVIDPRFYRGRWIFSPKAGFLRKPSALFWTLSLSYAL